MSPPTLIELSAALDVAALGRVAFHAPREPRLFGETEVVRMFERAGLDLEPKPRAPIVEAIARAAPPADLTAAEEIRWLARRRDARALLRAAAR